MEGLAISEHFPTKFSKWLDRFLTPIELLLAALSGLLLAAMVALITYGILIRIFRLGEIAWVVQLSGYVVLLSTFLAIPWIMKIDGHIQTDLLTNFLSHEVAKWVNRFGLTVGAVAGFLVTWFGVKVTLQAFERGIIVADVLRVPRFAVLMFIPLGTFFLSTRCMQKLVQSFSISNGRSHEGET